MARTWFVKHGDTWESIAASVGVPPEKLMRWNGVAPAEAGGVDLVPGTPVCASDPSLDADAVVAAPTTEQGIDEVPPSARRPLTFGRFLRYVGLAIVGITTIGRGLAATGIFKKPMGAYAEKAEQCRGGVMLSSQGGGMLAEIGGICSAQCNRDGDCRSSAFRCYEGSCAPTATKVFGETCSRPWECNTSLCVRFMHLAGFDSNPSDPAWLETPRSTCTMACSSDTPCPHGYACRPFEDRHLCAPDEPRADPSRYPVP